MKTVETELKMDEQYNLERFISNNVESCIRLGYVEDAEAWMEKYNEHNKEYVCQNQTRYLNLKRRVEKLKNEQKS